MSETSMAPEMVSDRTPAGEYMLALFERWQAEHDLANALADDVAAYRAVVVAGLNHAHELQAENRRLHRQLDALREEVRRLRDQVVTGNKVPDRYRSFSGTERAA